MAKESSMFGKFKGLFIVEEEGKASSNESVSSPKTRSNSSRKTTPTMPSPQSDGIPAGQVSEKFMKILFGAMEKANLDGFDYLEFKNSLQSLKKMQQMDEATRFQSAYAMAQTMGATPQNLISTAQHYLNVLKKEETKFEQALANNKKSQVGTKEMKMKELAESIKLKEEEIKRMTAEIEKNKKQYDKISSQIKGASTKIATTRANFMSSYQALAAQINRDIEKIKTYLK